MINGIQPKLPVGYTKDVSSIEGKPDVSRVKGQEINTTSAQVSLSEDAAVLQRVLEAVKDMPDVRDDLVQAIRAQLEAGTYEVDAEALAERLLPLIE
jgi:negative regulator of flagellin synthesis FlgM